MISLFKSASVQRSEGGSTVYAIEFVFSVQFFVKNCSFDLTVRFSRLIQVVNDLELGGVSFVTLLDIGNYFDVFTLCGFYFRG